MSCNTKRKNGGKACAREKENAGLHLEEAGKNLKSDERKKERKRKGKQQKIWEAKTETEREGASSKKK